MILVTGATGFLGRRVCLKLTELDLPHHRTSLSLGCDLRDRASARQLFESVRPAVVLNCAAFVGGIQFGIEHTVRLFDDNLHLALNLLDAAAHTRVRRIVNPIANCAYPARATVFREDEFWEGPLHDSVLVYGFVRKASWVGSWAYAKQFGLDTMNLILSNMYGPDDHFEEKRSHALGALVRKFVDAKREGRPEVVVWGSGQPVREWLYVDDGAEAMVRGMTAPAQIDPVNVGVGHGISIADLAHLIATEVNFAGRITFDVSRPDGAPWKTVDGTRGAQLLGWSPGLDLREGIQRTIEWYESHSEVAHAG